MIRHLMTVAAAEAISSERALSDEESLCLESIVRRLSPKREMWRWSEKEDRLLKALIRRRARLGRPKPFQRDDEVRRIAERLGRNYEAVHKRIQRLRKRSKCPRAGRKAKR